MIFRVGGGMQGIELRCVCILLAGNERLLLTASGLWHAELQQVLLMLINGTVVFHRPPPSSCPKQSSSLRPLD